MSGRGDSSRIVAQSCQPVVFVRIPDHEYDHSAAGHGAVIPQEQGCQRTHAVVTQAAGLSSEGLPDQSVAGHRGWRLPGTNAKNESPGSEFYARRRHNKACFVAAFYFHARQAEGKRTNATTIVREYQALLEQANKYFQSWERACLREEGHAMTSAAVASNAQYLYVVARKHFGSWDAACQEAAGIDKDRESLAASQPAHSAG